MVSYSYKAADSAGKIVRGMTEAVDERGAVANLQDQGLIPIRVAEATKGGSGIDLKFLHNLRSAFARVSSKDLLHFTQDLSAMLTAGLPVDRALSISIDVTENERFKEIIRNILMAVQGGSYLSDAMLKYPRVFSHFYTNMIKAGEAGGVLEDVLARLGVFLENSQELRDYIRSALIYPIFLLCIGGVSIIILMTFVIPKFSIIFEDLGQAVPLSTRFLIGTSQFFRSYWWVFLGLLAAGGYLFKRYRQTPSGRLKLDRIKLNLPVFGELVRKIEVARFARTLGTLIRSGVPILQALKLVQDIIGNRLVAGPMSRVHDRVKEGEKLSRPLADMGLFPTLAIQMITVGEETGRLEEMLLRVADNFEKVVRQTVKRLINLLEPVMILLMGVVVGFIVISMLMAIFSMNEMPF